MPDRGTLSRYGAFATGVLRHRRLVVLLAVLCVTGGVVAAQRLSPQPATALLAGRGSAIGAATAAQERAFGGEPIVIALEADLSQTLAVRNLAALLRLEGRLARLPGVHVVYGPATYANQAVVQMERTISSQLGPRAIAADRAARAAQRRARRAGESTAVVAAVGREARLQALGPLRDDYRDALVRIGTVGIPSLDNGAFVRALVFGTGVTPKPRMRWLFPDVRHALVIVRPDAGLGEAATLALGRRIRTLTAGAGLEGVRTAVGGAPLLAAAMSRATREDLWRLAPWGVLAMLTAVTLLLWRGGPRASLVGLALLAALLTGGWAGLLGFGLTPATVAALPVVVGLALDFAIQLRARLVAVRAAVATMSPDAAVVRALAEVGPPLTLAACATALGCLALTVTATPLLDQLGLLLALGSLTALGVVLALGPILLAWRPPGSGGPRLPAARLHVAPRWRGVLPAVLGGAAAAGVILSVHVPVESDLARLAPPRLAELHAVQRIQAMTGTAGELRIAVTAHDVAAPRVLAWMGAAQREIGRLDSRIAPGPNIGELATADGVQDAAAVRRILRLLPPYLTDAVLTRDHRRAELSLGVPLDTAEREAVLLRHVRRVLAGAPPGVRATPAGLVAAGATSVDELRSARSWLLALAGFLVLVLLLGVLRDPLRALIALLPAAVAAGLSGLALRAAGIHLTPLGAAVEPLVLAVGVEFGVVLEARFHRLRRDGAGPAAARARCVSEVGPAVLTSACAVTLGFAVLLLSDQPSLRQLGALVGLDVLVAALAAVLLVPAACAAVDRIRIVRTTGRVHAAGTPA